MLKKMKMPRAPLSKSWSCHCKDWLHSATELLVKIMSRMLSSVVVVFCFFFNPSRFCLDIDSEEENVIFIYPSFKHILPFEGSSYLQQIKNFPLKSLEYWKVLTVTVFMKN